MNESDQVRLQHMLDASKEVQAFVQGVSREALDTDVMLVRALSMFIGIIGEAASRVSSKVRETNPQIPWRSAITMRNFLFHAYFKVDLDVLWVTATENIPPLRVALEKLIEAHDCTDT